MPAEAHRAQLCIPALCTRKIHAGTLPASCLFPERDSAKLFPPGTCPSGQSLSGAERQVQHIPPTLDTETFGCIYTLLLVQLPLAMRCCVDIYLFIFLCCKSHLAEQPCTLALHPFLLLPFQVTFGPSCESSASISAESH